MKKYLKIDEIATLFGVSAHTILANQQRDGFPKPQKGLYDVRKVISWVVSRPNSKKGKMWMAATRLLSELKDDSESEEDILEPEKTDAIQKTNKSSHGSKNTTREEATVCPATVENPSEQPGEDVTSQLVPTVKKLSSVVDRYADMASASVDEGNIEMSAFYMKMLVPSIEAMRRGIESCLTVGKLRGDLLPVEDVQTAFTQMATNIRNKMLVMVKKLSHELVNIRSAGQVQRILEDEVSDVLENISRNPFGS